MDPICHTLVGLCLADSGLKRRTALGTATLVIAANLPDLDVLAIPLGQNLAWRRGWTHGILALVVWPLLLTGWMRWWSAARQRRDLAEPRADPRWLLLLSGLGVLTHPALDYLNTYGLRWLMPFADRWFYGDTLFIVDPWIWATLALGVFLTRRTERLGARDAGWPARVALALVSIYIGLMLGTTVAGRAMVARALETDPVEPAPTSGAGAVSPPPKPRYMVAPAPVNPLVKQVVVDEGRSYRIGMLRTAGAPGLTWNARVPKGDGTPAVKALKTLPAARPFLHWSRFPVFRERTEGDSVVVAIYDLRYASGSSRSWAMVEFTLPRRGPPAPAAPGAPTPPGARPAPPPGSPGGT